MVLKILLLVVILLGVFLITAAFQSEDFKIARSTFITAPADKIFPLVNDLKAFDQWNPFMECDPQVKVNYDGPVSGVGMSSTWSGNNQIGAGKDTIVESKPTQLVGMRLDFERPMKSTSSVIFTFAPQAQGTLVTWSMTGKKNYMAKIFHMLMNMDKMIGGSFEKGLFNLKTMVEKK
jgi:uncharacterized protein YndB with AHSA1/START domain